MDWIWLLLAAHVFAGILFLGNIIVTFVWKLFADRTGDIGLMRFGAKLVIDTDHIFTAPMAGLLVASGLALAHIKGYPLLATPWLLAALILFALSGLVWVIWLVPNQKRQKALLEPAADASAVSLEHRALRQQWNVYGVLSVLFALGAFLMMFLKDVI